MWRAVQAKARRTIALANQHGLTVERPYIIKDGMVWGVFDGSLCPMFGGSYIPGPYTKLPS